MTVDYHNRLYHVIENNISFYSLNWDGYLRWKHLKIIKEKAADIIKNAIQFWPDDVSLSFDDGIGIIDQSEPMEIVLVDEQYRDFFIHVLNEAIKQKVFGTFQAI